MNRKKIFIGLVAVVVIGVLLWWLLSPSKMAPTAEEPERISSTPQSQSASAASTPTPPIEERRKTAIENIIGALTTSITFYGKVIDQNGDPVPDADVGYTALDKFDASGSHYTGKSDSKGLFEVSGIKGAALTVGVGKKRYYPIDGKSTGAFAYGIGPDSRRKAPPTKDNPAVFVLHKMGETEPMAYVGTRYYKVTKDGQPMEIDLETGREVPVSRGDIRFERWANDKIKDERGNFDWRFRITIPNGGLMERQDQFAFEAPQDGYQNVIEINMPSSLGEKWQYAVNKSYFIKLPDGRYARISASIQAGHDNPAFKLDAFVNPKPGSRNLEFDPAKVVKSP